MLGDTQYQLVEAYLPITKKEALIYVSQTYCTAYEVTNHSQLIAKHTNNELWNPHRFASFCGVTPADINKGAELLQWQLECGGGRRHHFLVGVVNYFHTFIDTITQSLGVVICHNLFSSATHCIMMLSYSHGSL